MRLVLCALAVLTLPPSAFAADYDLRGAEPVVGPAPFTRWSGFYAGGQFGFSDAKGSFNNATQAPIAFLLRQTTLQNEIAPSSWPVLGTANKGASGYGGFVGYNSQWQDLVLGLEANYTHTTISMFAPNSPISRVVTTSGGTVYLVNLSGSGAMSDLDFGSLRLRAGWVLDNFMPYGFAGVAVGRTNLSVTANISGEQNFPPSGGPCLVTNTPSCTTFAYSASAGKSNELLYGFDIGGGVDWAISQNIFLRGEYEYTQFAPVDGVVIAVSSARIGGGVKF